jgi:predicted GNAT family acetyltransferase
MASESQVQHDKTNQRFVISFADKSSAYLEYDVLTDKDGQILDMYHTFTPTTQRGKGVAAIVTKVRRIVKKWLLTTVFVLKAALDYVAENNLRFTPTCSYISTKFLVDNPEYLKFVAKKDSSY